MQKNQHAKIRLKKSRTMDLSVQYSIPHSSHTRSLSCVYRAGGLQPARLCSPRLSSSLQPSSLATLRGGLHGCVHCSGLAPFSEVGLFSLPRGSIHCTAAITTRTRSKAGDEAGEARLEAGLEATLEARLEARLVARQVARLLVARLAARLTPAETQYT